MNETAVRVPDLETVTVRLSGADHNIAVIELQRPKVFNALNCQLFADLSSAIDFVETQDIVKAAIVTGGSCKHFCAGADLDELQGKGTELAEIGSHFHVMRNMTKPMIASVRGAALGGGCEVALMGDVLYAGTSAFFAFPELSCDTIPGCGGTQRLTAAIGKSRAMEMILSGGRIGASLAQDWGLVTRVFPDEEVDNAAIALAERITRFSEPVVRKAKQAIAAFVEQQLTALPIETKLFLSTFDATSDAEIDVTEVLRKTCI